MPLSGFLKIFTILLWFPTSCGKKMIITSILITTITTYFEIFTSIVSSLLKTVTLFFFFFDSENNWKKIKNSALSQEGKTVICTINSYNTVQTYVISFKKWTIGRMRLWMSERRDTNEVGPPTGAWLKTMFPCGTEK